MKRLLALLAVAALAVAVQAVAAPPKFALGSPAFTSGGTIPVKYTCDGANVSPPLVWTTPPRGTRSLALLVHDPDAPGGRFTHWIAWDISPRARRLQEGARLRPQGRNDTDRVGWFGPCPPPGPAHRYVFRLYALKSSLALRTQSDRRAFDVALRGKVLAVTTLVGRHGR